MSFYQLDMSVLFVVDPLKTAWSENASTSTTANPNKIESDTEHVVNNVQCKKCLATLYVHVTIVCNIIKLYVRRKTNYVHMS